MGILIISGLILAILAWVYIGWWAGIIIGFLFCGGFGWKLLFSLFGRFMWTAEKQEFIRAWEERFGKMEFGNPRLILHLGCLKSGKQKQDKLARVLGSGWIDSILLAS